MYQMLVQLIVFSLCPFPDESAGMYHIWCQSVQPFGRLSRCLNFWPPKTSQMPPWYLEELIVFSLCPFPDESTHVCQIWCQLVNPFGSYSRFWLFWPPKTPLMPPRSDGHIFYLAHSSSSFLSFHQESCPLNCALPMPGTADGDVVSRCQVLGRAGSVHHGADQ